ncbi:dipeptidase [Chryseomicrobium aureum]|uniref:dipeptidase n=1 Tax=Chryseomicrobium aureum TaxID=1441723 RepID=UPI00370D863C
MTLIDLHCDHLYKLQKNFQGELDTSIERLRAGGITAQAFAIYVEPSLSAETAYTAAMHQVELFHKHVLSHPDVHWVRNWPELAERPDGKISVFLTLEGLECIGNELTKLDAFLDAGVLSVGLTWNPANLVADGCGEPRGAGLTTFGRQVVARLNERGILVDLAHIAEAGFWETLELAEFPIVSHANARALCDHPRNLSDTQLRAMIEKGIPLHIVFYPGFISGKDHAEIDELIVHFEHIVALGGEDIIGFGSDFDGINIKVDGLEHAGQFPHLLERLRSSFSDDQVEKWMYKNFYRYVMG